MTSKQPRRTVAQPDPAKAEAGRIADPLAQRRADGHGPQTFYFANARVECDRDPGTFAAFTRERAFARTIRLSFSDVEIPEEGAVVFQTEEIVCRDTGGGWLFTSAIPAIPARLSASYDYATLTAWLPPCEFEEGQRVKLLHLIRTAIECAMPSYGAISLHSACVALDGRAVAYTAMSGTGKSVRAQQWVNTLGAKMISGDRPAVRLTAEGADICGVPWDGKEQIFAPVEYPLRAILEVRRAPFHRIRRLSQSQARRLMHQQCFMPMWDNAAAVASFMFIKKLCARVPIYRVFGGMDAASARLTHSILYSPIEGNSRIEEARTDMKVKEGFVLRNVVGEHIVMPVGKNIDTFEGAIVLNDVSAFIWENLQRPVAREDLLRLILGEFEVEEQTAAKDLDAFLDKLRGHGLLEEQE